MTEWWSNESNKRMASERIKQNPVIKRGAGRGVDRKGEKLGEAGRRGVVRSGQPHDKAKSLLLALLRPQSIQRREMILEIWVLVDCPLNERGPLARLLVRLFRAWYGA